MDSFFDEALTKLRTRLEVQTVLTGLCGDVEAYWQLKAAAQNKENVSYLQMVATRLARRVRALQAERAKLQEELRSVRTRAAEVRTTFALDISAVLMESKSVQTLRKRVKDLEERIEVLKQSAEEEEEEEEEEKERGTAPGDKNGSADSGDEMKHTSADADDRSSQAANVAIIVEQPSPSPPLQPPAPPRDTCLLSDVSDKALLHMFSYLDTAEVLVAAQVNRFVFQRIDCLFGTDSAVVKPEWSIRHPPLASAEPQQPELSSNGAAQESSLQKQQQQTTFESAASATKNFFSTLIEGAGGASTQAVHLPKEFLDALSKKLSAAELKAVVALNDAMKKKVDEVDQLSAERDDVAARLQNTETVRDFLVQKLRAAEVALKAAMSEAAQLRKQAAADGEIMSFLDLRGQDLEAQAQDLEHTRQHLQATLNLQQGTYASAEKRLSAELFEVQTKLEDCEASHRAQKKLLVKEVKSLRCLLEMTTKERNIYHAQLRVLRDTLSGATL
jgi:chromosome segregation ATPase